MNWPIWVGTHSETLAELKVSPNQVMLALISGVSSEFSVATVFKSENLAHLSKNPASLQEALELVNHILTPETTFRLIGTESQFAFVSPFLQSLQLKEGKHVPLIGTQPTVIHFLPEEGRIRVLKNDSLQPRSTKRRVLVVDDSETIRKLLSRIINDDPQLECVATIGLPSLALEAIEKHKPDVITLDIHMPEMDGLTLLRKILPRFSIPVVMISALSKEDGTYVLDALEAGAVDYIQKPSLSEVKNVSHIICEKIKSASFAKVQHRPENFGLSKRPLIALSSQDLDFSYLIAIGSSTGGTEALKTVLTQFPEKIPPVLIVQHIPPVFSKAFAEET